MDLVLKAEDVEVEFHPAGYRIDQTASPMDRYTKWDIQENHWCNPEPVCFDSLPREGWIAKDKFNWHKDNTVPELI